VAVASGAGCPPQPAATTSVVGGSSVDRVVFADCSADRRNVFLLLLDHKTRLRVDAHPVETLL
jgi:hypothetical protein